MDQSDKRGPTLPHLLGGGRAKVEFRVGLTPGLSVNGVRAGAPLSYLITSVAKVLLSRLSLTPRNRRP